MATTTETETVPWQAQIIDQLADADTENATHVICELAGDDATIREITDSEEDAATRAAAIAVDTENGVSIVALETLYAWHKEQLAEAQNDVGQAQEDFAEAAAHVTADADAALEPDPESGKLFDVPRVGILLDDSDPSLLKLAFSGSIELERNDKTSVDLYNRLRSGKSVRITVEAHVAGAGKKHRRDKEGDADAIVETKSLIVTDVHLEG